MFSFSFLFCLPKAHLRAYFILSMFGLIFWLDTPIIFAQKPASVRLLEDMLNDLDTSNALKNAQWGFIMKANSTKGNVIAQKHSHRSMMPASTMKVVTTGAALSLLGENFMFKTIIEHDGNLETDGTLNGNLYIRGGGDPTLGSDHLRSYDTYNEVMQQWAAKISGAGIKRIKGYVIADADIFADNMIPEGWTWGDIGNYFGAGISGLNINENYYRMIFNPGAVGDKAQILRIEPNIPQMQIINEVVTDESGTGDHAFIYGAPYQLSRWVSGTVPSVKREFGIKGAMPDPPFIAAHLLGERLKNIGIGVVSGPTSTRILRASGLKLAAINDRKELFVHLSPPLANIVSKTNIYSLNLYAECILRMIGSNAFSEPTSQAGIKAVETYWRMKSMNQDGFFMTDGSGLSQSNGLTPSQLCHVFYSMSKEKSYKTFYGSLSVAGQSGTLSDMCVGTPAAYNVRAKSGTLTRVMCYSGYVKMANGQMASFAFMANKYTGNYYALRKKVEKLLVLMAKMK